MAGAIPCIQTSYRYPPLRGYKQAIQMARQCGLSGAIRPQNNRKFTLMEL
jgi:hypothetical protein